jgi:hypothetical protein
MNSIKNMIRTQNSAPGVGFETSVRVRNENKYKQKNEIDNNKIQNRSNIYNKSNLLDDNQMRDLYNRKKKIEYWMGKISILGLPSSILQLPSLFCFVKTLSFFPPSN